MSDGTKQKKRANGEGSPRQRSNGLYEIRQMVDGRRRSFYGKTPKEARTALNRALRQAEQGRDFHAPRERVDAYLARWLTDVAALRVSDRTLRGYREVVALHLAPALGRCWLDALSASDVQKMLTQKSRDGLSPRRVAQIRAVLRTALSDAERMALVGRNAAKPVSLPAMPATKVRALDADAAQAILDATADDRYGPFYAVALHTGLRAGEMAGLRWSDVNLDGAAVSVRQSLKNIPGAAAPVFGPPKSRRSVRDVPLSAAAIAALKRQRARQAEERLAAGKGWQDFGLVFTRPNGRPVDSTEVGRALHRALDAAGLPPCRLHDLRHGTATLLIGAGVPLATVSRVLGHSTIQVTMDTYAHLSDTVQREAAHAMDRMFGTA